MMRGVIASARKIAASMATTPILVFINSTELVAEVDSMPTFCRAKERALRKELKMIGGYSRTLASKRLNQITMVIMAAVPTMNRRRAK